jgi:hypothetical protein
MVSPELYSILCRNAAEFCMVSPEFEFQSAEFCMVSPEFVPRIPARELVQQAFLGW